MLHLSVPYLLHFINLWDARVRRAGNARQVHWEQIVVWRGHAWGQSVMYGVRVKTINGVLGVRVRAIGMYGVRWKERPVCWVNFVYFVYHSSWNRPTTQTLLLKIWNPGPARFVHHGPERGIPGTQFIVSISGNFCCYWLSPIWHIWHFITWFTVKKWRNKEKIFEFGKYDSVIDIKIYKCWFRTY